LKSVRLGGFLSLFFLLLFVYIPSYFTFAHSYQQQRQQHHLWLTMNTKVFLFTTLLLALGKCFSWLECFHGLTMSMVDDKTGCVCHFVIF
jgi:hypothetical protein